MKPFIKRDERTDARTHGRTDARMDGRTDGHGAFYNIPSRAYRPAGDKNVMSNIIEKLQWKSLIKVCRSVPR